MEQAQKVKMSNDEVNEELTKLENEKIKLVNEQQENEEKMQDHEQKKQILIMNKRRIDSRLVEVNIKLAQLRRNFKIEGFKTSKMRKMGVSDKERIIRDRGGKCEGCKAADNLTVHHKLPLSHGGTDHPENLEVLCPECHSRRHRV